ncbi:peptidoglycan editing factor PgeF [Bombella sp. TMW 2.2559]|uniref:Purine nucleoside phosphorylase n=1 Tax=Bombella dulcis TaxID=2967339 RepID=A0ABT3WBC5_9PROT|nr:peptidoglycan editing factor PgeF [Bombella dulcis]MCX5616371.1 peptidoglycan editing factor PgeF [Bombella dulcis]
MIQPPFFLSSLLPVRHGFFTRHGGVSAAPYETLNGGLGTQDQPEDVQENRCRMAAAVGVEPEHFVALRQVHGADVHVLRHGQEVWSHTDGHEVLPAGDALVTDCPEVALGVATADCAPVLLSSDDGRIVGAAHAGWRGAVGGVLEQTVEQMRLLGAEGLRAVVGPCIGPASYEVGGDMRRAVLERHPEGDRFFVPAARDGHCQFDLPAFCLSRLERLGVKAEWTGHDTLADEQFFSHRRATLKGDARTGRQVSVIRAGRTG